MFCSNLLLSGISKVSKTKIHVFYCFWFDFFRSLVVIELTHAALLSVCWCHPARSSPMKYWVGEAVSYVYRTTLQCVHLCVHPLPLTLIGSNASYLPCESYRIWSSTFDFLKYLNHGKSVSD